MEHFPVIHAGLGSCPNCPPAPHQCCGSHYMELFLGQMGEHKQTIMSINHCSHLLPCGWHSVHTSSPGLGTQIQSPFGFLFIVTVSGSSCNQLLCRTCEIHDPPPQNFPEPRPIAIKEDFWPRNSTHYATYPAWALLFLSVQSLRWVLGSADAQRNILIHSFLTSTLDADSNNQQLHSCAASSEEYIQMDPE